MNILLTCVGRRNYLVNYFKEALAGNGLVVACDMDRTAPGMVDADQSIVVPRIYDKEYIPSLVKIIRDNEIKAVISLNDLELPILSANRVNIETLGARLVVSSPAVINLTFDKMLTAEAVDRWFADVDLSVRSPFSTTNIEEIKQRLEERAISFPIVCKPRWGSASIGIEFCHDMEELMLGAQLSKIKLQRTILAQASNGDLEHALLYQEMIQGEEYGMDVLNDFEGNYVGTFVRKKLNMRSGETDKAISVVDDRFEAIGRVISQNLKHIGNLDCDILERDGRLYLLEMNARFGGGYPFSHEAGARGVGCYVAWLLGSGDVSFHLNYQADKMFSKCDRLIEI